MKYKAPLIIAEAGVNHNGDLDTAKKLIDAAAHAGADVVKFQSFVADRLASPNARKARYQIDTTGRSESQHAMLRRLELSRENHRILIDHCKATGITFLSTPFDPEGLKMLAQDFDLPQIKLGSGEVTNAPLLLAAAQTGKNIILSTGMSSLGEVENALGVLAFGYSGRTDRPSTESFSRALCAPESHEYLKEKVILMHCTSEYPTPPEHINLKAMQTLRAAFDLPVGLSDHSEGIHIPVAATALGARVIEKHFTLDRTQPGPDHKASLDPADLSAMVHAIREVVRAMGDGIKRTASDDERDTKAMAQKSLYAARDLPAGQVLDEGAIIVLRPGPVEGGLPPDSFWRVLGKKTRRALRHYDPITEGDLAP